MIFDLFFNQEKFWKNALSLFLRYTQIKIIGLKLKPKLQRFDSFKFKKKYVKII